MATDTEFPQPSFLDNQCEHEITLPGSKDKVPHAIPGCWYTISREGGTIEGKVCLCDEHKDKMIRQGYRLVKA